MDVKYINPFIHAVSAVMPQLGFTEVTREGVSIKDSNIKSMGVLIILGIVGDIKGNVAYCIDMDSAKKIASTMMMGMPVNELDEMAQSALSELTNMITANAATDMYSLGININISAPTLMYGNDFEAKMSSNKLICIQLSVDGIPIEVNVGIE